MADIQMGHEIAKPQSLNEGGDGTNDLNVGYEARHVNILVPIYESDEGANAMEHQS